MLVLLVVIVMVVDMVVTMLVKGRDVKLRRAPALTLGWVMVLADQDATVRRRDNFFRDARNELRSDPQ